MDGTWGTGIIPYNPDVQFLSSRESEKWSHSVRDSSEFALTEDLYPQSKTATLQYVIYLYIVELSSWHVDQCLICSFVLTWYITQSIFHMPSAKWKWLKLFLLKPMAQHITVSCIKCDLTNILLLCWSKLWLRSLKRVSLTGPRKLGFWVLFKNLLFGSEDTCSQSKNRII